MARPLLLDLFCCSGGAGVGYTRAGFHVVGVDIDAAALRYNPHECYQGDALSVMRSLLRGKRYHGYRLSDFSLIHASPPCQDTSVGRYITGTSGVYPRLIGPTRQLLEASQLPYIIENVMGAALIEKELHNALMLCGTSFGLRVERHRYFESNLLLFSAGPCFHKPGNVTVRRKRAEYIGIWSGATYRSAKGEIRKRPKSCPLSIAKAAMGIDWPMPGAYLGEAIPPAYTAWLGSQALAQIATQSADAPVGSCSIA